MSSGKRKVFGMSEYQDQQGRLRDGIRSLIDKAREQANSGPWQNCTRCQMWDKFVLEFCGAVEAMMTHQDCLELAAQRASGMQSLPGPV